MITLNILYVIITTYHINMPLRYVDNMQCVVHCVYFLKVSLSPNVDLSILHVVEVVAEGVAQGALAIQLEDHLRGPLKKDL